MHPRCEPVQLPRPATRSTAAMHHLPQACGVQQRRPMQKTYARTACGRLLARPDPPAVLVAVLVALAVAARRPISLRAHPLSSLTTTPARSPVDPPPCPPPQSSSLLRARPRLTDSTSSEGRSRPCFPAGLRQPASVNSLVRGASWAVAGVRSAERWSAAKGPASPRSPSRPRHGVIDVGSRPRVVQ